jgi:flagellar P-ring protein precursor FlgI
VLAANMDQYGRVTLIIDDANATWPMANTLTTLINDVMSPEGPAIAVAADQKNIVIQVPPREQPNPASFIAQVLEINLDPTLIRTEARVVINERTNTIVMTGDVQISPVAISHEGLTISTLTPPPVPTPDQPLVEEEQFVGIDPDARGGARMADLLNAFNQLKVPAEDRIAIIKQMHTAGQLHAKLLIED